MAPVSQLAAGKGWRAKTRRPSGFGQCPIQGYARRNSLLGPLSARRHRRRFVDVFWQRGSQVPALTQIPQVPHSYLFSGSYSVNNVNRQTWINGLQVLTTTNGWGAGAAWWH